MLVQAFGIIWYCPSFITSRLEASGQIPVAAHIPTRAAPRAGCARSPRKDLGRCTYAFGFLSPLRLVCDKTPHCVIFITLNHAPSLALRFGVLDTHRKAPCIELELIQTCHSNRITCHFLWVGGWGASSKFSMKWEIGTSLDFVRSFKYHIYAFSELWSYMTPM